MGYSEEARQWKSIRFKLINFKRWLMVYGRLTAMEMSRTMGDERWFAK